MLPPRGLQAVDSMAMMTQSSSLAIQHVRWGFEDGNCAASLEMGVPWLRVDENPETTLVKVELVKQLEVDTLKTTKRHTCFFKDFQWQILRAMWFPLKFIKSLRFRWFWTPLRFTIIGGSTGQQNGLTPLTCIFWRVWKMGTGLKQAILVGKMLIDHDSRWYHDSSKNFG